MQQNYFLYLLFFVMLLPFISCDDSASLPPEIPEPEERYYFPYQSVVDADDLDCGYESYEYVGKLVKKRVARKVGELSNKKLERIGEIFHEAYIPLEESEHERKPWAERIVKKMKPYLQNQELAYKVFSVKSPQFNAFTIPGGNIYVTDGLLDEVRNEEELAYIIGHELAHNENGHTEAIGQLYLYTEEQMEEGGFLASSESFILEVSAAICGKPDELECDIASMYLVHVAGYDPDKALGGIELLKKFTPQKPENSWEASVSTFLSTHPWSDDREACVENYVGQAKVRAECDSVYENRRGIVNKEILPLNMREFPIELAESVYEIPAQEKVRVICDCVEQPSHKTESWLYVEYKEDEDVYRGWVNAAFVGEDQE